MTCAIVHKYSYLRLVVTRMRASIHICTGIIGDFGLNMEALVAPVDKADRHLQKRTLLILSNIDC